MSGELTADEAISYSIVTNKLEECTISIPSPFDEDSTIDLYVTLDKDTKNDIEFASGSPYVTCQIFLSARILSATQDANYFDDDNLSLIESYANSYIKSEIENYFYKTSKEFKSDISLLGRYAVKSFLTTDEWDSYNWLDNYTNSFFYVSVETNVISSYLIS